VATLTEFRQARGLLFAEAARVRPAPEQLSIGTMLEVPALLWQMQELMAEADFISIGSNDLMQFVFAADRGTPALAERYDFISMPMLRLVHSIIEQAERSHCALSLCGEAASRPLDAAVLLAIGLNRLSMSASSILGVKEALTALHVGEFRSYLETLRRTAATYSSLREPISGWARDHGLKI
jgi:phosphotransferase system enzyme I (PtsP)